MSLKSMMLSGVVLMVAASFAFAQDPVLTEPGAAVVQEQVEEMASDTLRFGISVDTLWLVAPIASILALIFAVFFYVSMMKNSEGTDKMKEIAKHVREGAYAYLYAQYKVVGIVFVVLFLVFAVLAKMGVQNPFVPIAFLTGGFFSGLCGFLGMKTATNASARTAQGASESLNKGLQIAFRSGAVMGLIVVGFGLIDICIWYLLLDKVVYTAEHMAAGGEGFHFLGMQLVHPGMSMSQKYMEITTTMLTFGMGASTQALFARVGGGIYTKAADVGADLVGKVEAGIPEDDPRNPATIADNVGDNVGDVAGMGADLYESYCGSILATAALGAAIPALGAKGVLAPMIIAGVGILLSIIGCLMVRCGDKSDMKTLMKSLTNPLWFSTAAIAVVTAGMAYIDLITWGVFGSVVAGLVSGCLIGLLTEYYTSDEYKPTKGISEQAKMGPATAIIDGLAVGMFSSGLPTVVIVLGILSAFGFAGGFVDFASGLYGVGFAAVGMLATLGFSLATDAYGPIADNAGGNAEMAGLGEEVRHKTDALDMLGNTTAAIGKGFAIGSAALTAMALMAAYLEEIRIWLGKLADKPESLIAGARQVGDVLFTTASYTGTTDATQVEGVSKVVEVATAQMLDFSQAYNLTVLNPQLLCGIFIGAMMAFVFCAMTMKAVGRAAGAMVNEVRRQFREIAGIMEGTGTPDYANCVAISTKGAQREMMIPSMLAIIVPVIVGIILGVSGVIGLLVGGLTTGFTLACMLNNAGGAWDNAKKSIEKQEKTYAADDKEKKYPLTGKGSETHKAGVVGDTVGDPFKDTSGPSLNILIKLMTMVSVVFSGVIVAYGDQLKVLVDFLTKK